MNIKVVENKILNRVFQYHFLIFLIFFDIFLIFDFLNMYISRGILGVFLIIREYRPKSSTPILKAKWNIENPASSRHNKLLQVSPKIFIGDLDSIPGL